MAALYWIRCRDHTSPKTQGYIGVTDNIDIRMSQHAKADGSAPILARAINKYGWDSLVKEKLWVYSNRKEALDMEAYLRDKPGIGWNCAVGGQGGPGTLWFKDPLNSERHAKAIRDALMKKTPQERSASIKRAKDTLGPAGRSMASKKALSTLGEEGLRARAKKANETKGVYGRSAATCKGWVTRRINKLSKETK